MLQCHLALRLGERAGVADNEVLTSIPLAERDTSVHGEPEGAPSLTDDQAVERLNEAYRKITGELGKVIVGQKRVIEELLIGMFAGGHCLLEGVPGLAKTLMVRTLADTLDL